MSVSVVLPRTIVPAWQHEILNRLSTADLSTLSVVVGGNDDRSDPLTLFRRWKQFDLKTFRNKLPNGKSSEDLIDIRDDQSLDSLDIETAVSADSLVSMVSNRIPDVIVWLLPGRPSPDMLSLPKFGVWFLANSNCETTGYYELVKREPVTKCTLTVLALNSSDDQLISAAFAATDPLSLCRGLLAVRAKDRSLLLSMLRQVRYARQTPPPVSGSIDEPRPEPGVLNLLSGLARLYARYATTLVTRLFRFDQWQIFYRQGGNRLNQNGMTRFAPDHGGFWADPFVFNRNGRTALFFEEMPENGNRGKILAAEFGPDGLLQRPSVIIERDYHMSYPFLFEFEGDLYMAPESAEAGKVEAFRCAEFPFNWEPHAVLLEGICAYDATLIEHDDRWWMFVSVEDNGNSSSDELHLFYALHPFGEWSPHPMNPVNADVRSARPGGALYREDGILYRPAQDCSVRYGYALSIRKILRMTVDDYEEEEAGRILPDWAPGSLGTHTVNQEAGITVYDSMIRRGRKFF